MFLSAQSGQIRLTTLCAIVIALSVSALGAFKALTFKSSPIVGNVSPAATMRQPEFHAETVHRPRYRLTGTSSPRFRTSLTPIEELQVGQRVRADAPTEDVDRQFGDEVVPSEWRKLTLTAPKRDGTVADVVLLRPRWWIEQQQAEVDGQVFISVPECGIDGDATVHSIGPCPEIVSGPGRFITGRFRHRVAGGIELSVEGESQPIRCTGNHPIWSEDRHDFVRADSLKPGETLRITGGLAAVVSSRPLTGDTFVYNIEVHRTHVYHVGNQGTVVHNALPRCLVEEANAVKKALDADITDAGVGVLHVPSGKVFLRPASKTKSSHAQFVKELGYNADEVRGFVVTMDPKSAKYVVENISSLNVQYPGDSMKMAHELFATVTEKMSQLGF